MSTLYNPVPTTIYDNDGHIAVGATAEFFAAGTSTPLTVYADNDQTTPLAPVTNAGGRFPPIYLPLVDYKVRISTAGGDILFQADHVANSPASSGGGGEGVGEEGGAVDPASIFTTGMTMWMVQGGPRAGWVRMNGRTIGSATSISATERADADTRALFDYLYATLSDTIAPVIGGRGSTSAADWAAGKSITIPTMQGLAAIGSDDMGNAPADKIQTSTTCSAINGSTGITVASAANLARGMYVIIAGVAAGTITAINGTAVTLNTAYAGTTGSGKTVRASFFPDAQTVGSVGGAQTVTQTEAELAAHYHTADQGTIGSGSGVQDGTGWGEVDIDINSRGGGLPMNNMQPSRLGTFYMKL